jgi:ferredoxin
MEKKVKVNKDVCVGCGACTAICAEIFALGDDGLAEVVAPVTDDVIAGVEDAQASCPVGAIEID